jgi:hypothetical protein
LVDFPLLSTPRYQALTRAKLGYVRLSPALVVTKWLHSSPWTARDITFLLSPTTIAPTSLFVYMLYSLPVGLFPGKNCTELLYGILAKE